MKKRKIRILEHCSIRYHMSTVHGLFGILLYAYNKLNVIIGLW